MLKFIFPFLFLCTTTASAQHREIILSCHPTTDQCDTLQINEADEQGRLTRKVDRDKKNIGIRYFYDTNGRLIRKEQSDSTGRLLRINSIHYNKDIWVTDSLFDAAGKLLVVLRQDDGDSTGLYIVKWYFGNDTLSSAEQRIKRQTDGSELSNSTCYAPDNCITYTYHYREGRIVMMETWVLQPEFNTPRLTESEEYVYDEKGKLISTVRFLEPEHRNIALLKHYYHPLR